MKREFKGFVAGVLVMAALFGMIGTAGAVVGKMQANLDYNNIKITTQEDLLMGERIIKERMR